MYIYIYNVCVCVCAISPFLKPTISPFPTHLSIWLLFVQDQLAIGIAFAHQLCRRVEVDLRLVVLAQLVVDGAQIPGAMELP